MADVLVTGATGFIGGALLDSLVADGRDVAALVRRPPDADAIRDRGAEPVLGDLQDQASLRQAVTGSRVVFHVAGLNAMCLRRPGRLDRVNVDGTRALVAASAAAGVEKVVYTSSAATIGERRGVVGSETTEHRGSYLSAYERSKHHAEVAAFSEAERLGIPLIAVNPSSVQGPGRTGGTARILIGYLTGRLRFAMDTRLSVVSIGDVVAAHRRAEVVGEPGQRYLVNGWTTTVRGAIDTLQAVTGIRRRVRMVPSWVLGVAGRVVGAASALLGRDAPICPEMVRALRHGHSYDGSRIEREWGFAYTPPEDWLAETVEWYRERGIT